MEMEEYILHHIDPEGDYLNKLYRETHLQLLYPHMVSGHLQGRILKMLTHMVNPKNVLEIGTYSGYSALCMAEGLHSKVKHWQHTESTCAQTHPSFNLEHEYTIHWEQNLYEDIEFYYCIVTI